MAQLLCISLVLKSAIFENGNQLFLLGILPKDQELEKVICATNMPEWGIPEKSITNVALSMRTGPHTLYNLDYKGRSSKNRFRAIIFDRGVLRT